MRTFAVLLLCVFLAAPVTLRSQGTVLEIIEEEYTSQTLSGKVFLGQRRPGAEAMGILVELCTPDWKDVIHSTKTVSEGRFSFPMLTPKSEDLYYLRLSAEGVNTLLVKVRIRPSGPNGASLLMEFST